ncbi:MULTISPECIES: hypothetical protein [Spirulina sp. CCY15215]|nr:hypothetical protein [Spirulina major]
MKYITPLFWSFLAVIALIEFSTPLGMDAIAPDSMPDLMVISRTDMTILK